MKISEAIDMARHLKRALIVAGEGNLSAPYTEIQMVKALIVYFDHTGHGIPASGEDLTRVKRQLTAANARLAKWEKTRGFQDPNNEV
jgi:hypothetical protein